MYKKHLEKMLPPARLHHSYCVAEQAKKLAKLYNADVRKAEVAGLLHDITKALPPEEHLKIISKADIKLDDIQRVSVKLFHSISGSIYIVKHLGIKDPEIISAVRYHTTAKANLSLLEKIVYLADFTSADRKFSDVVYMREVVNKSLDEGMKIGLIYTIKDLLKASSPIHPDTFLAYNCYIVR